MERPVFRGLTCNQRVAYWIMTNVFSAVSDSTRRAILGRLRREGPLSVTELAAGLPMSRQAVTKHLDVLAGAGLIGKRVEGRERLHELHAEPLKEVEDWLAPYSAAWDERLERLRAHVESKTRSAGET